MLQKNIKKLKFNRTASTLCTLLRVGADYLAVLLVVLLSEVLRDALVPTKGAMSLPSHYHFAILPFCYMLFAHLYGLYTTRRQFSDEILSVLKSVCLGAITASVILYLTQDAATTSRLFLVIWAILLFPFLAFERLVLKHIVKGNKFLATPALILLGGSFDLQVMKDLHEGIGVGYNFIGYLSSHAEQDRAKTDVPHIGSWEDADDVLWGTGIQDVFIIAHKLSLSGIEGLVEKIQPRVKRISVIPTLGNLPLSSVDLVQMLDGRFAMFNLRNNLNFWQNRLIKFLFDYFVTLIGTILISPLLLIIAIAVKLDSKGPVFFAQERIGYGGKKFNCYKFRSMRQDAEQVLNDILAKDPALKQEWDTFHKMKNDPRITRIGKILRAASLDELPQLFNILRGEMSLVGPRPCCEFEIVNYGDLIHSYSSVRPAITGLWQTSGRNSLDFSDRVRLDVWYTKNWTLWLDIVILWRTLWVVLRGKGAY